MSNHVQRRQRPQEEILGPTDLPPHKQSLVDVGAFVEWEPGELSAAYEVFDAGPGTKRRVTDYLASQTLRILNNRSEFAGMFDPLDVQRGTAEGLKFLNIPASQAGKGLRNEDVLRYFTNLKQFDDPGVPTRKEAFLSGALEGGGAMVGGAKGARYGVMAGSFAGLPGQIAGGTLGFLGGAILGGAAGDAVGDLTMDQIEADIPLTPNTESLLKIFQATGSAAPFIFNPALAPNARITQAKYLQDLPKRNAYGPVTKEEILNNPFLAKYLQGKSLRFPRAVGAAEDLLISGGAMFRGAQTPAGKVIALGVESAQIPATFLATTAFAGESPRSDTRIIAGEMLGGMAPSLNILRFVPAIAKAGKDYVAARKASIQAGQGLDLLGRKERIKRDQIQYILGLIEERGENPADLLKALEEIYLNENGQIKKEFLTLDKKGQRVPESTFSSAFVESPALANLDAQVMKMMAENEGGELLNNSFRRSMNAQTALVNELRGTGDPELLKIANQIQAGRIEFLMQKRMDQAVGSAIAAVNKVYPEGGEQATEALGQGIANAQLNVQKVFKNIQEKAWDNVNQRIRNDTFYRFDSEGNIIPDSASDVPNIVEAWESMLREMENEKSTLLAVMGEAEFRNVNEVVNTLKERLGLGTVANPFDGVTPATKKFNEALGDAAGEQWFDTYNRLLAEADLEVINGTVAPTLENLEKLAGVIETQRPNKYRDAFDKARNKLAGTRDVFGNSYQDEALRVEREALAGPALDANELDNAALELQMGLIESSNQNYMRDTVERQANEILQMDADALRQYLTELDASDPQGQLQQQTQEFFKTYAQAALARTGERLGGSTQDAIDALRAQTVGLKDLGEVGKLRKAALEARIQYLDNMISREADEVAGRETTAPAGPLGRLLTLQKKSLTSEMRRANELVDMTPTPEEGGIPASELISLRKTLRIAADKFGAANGNGDFFRRAVDLRRAALNDLRSYESVGPAYQNALDASVAYQEFFKKTFGGDLLRKNSQGRIVVEPDLAAITIFTGNKDASALRLRQIERANLELADRAVASGATEEDLAEIAKNLGTQQDLLEMSLREVLRRATGKVEQNVNLTPVQIRERQLQNITNWASDNAVILKLFPDLQKEINNIRDPQEFINRVQAVIPRITQQRDSMAAFQYAMRNGKGVLTENPTELIRLAYTSKNPSEQLRVILKNMTTLPPEAAARETFKRMGISFPEDGVPSLKDVKEGLLATTINWAFDTSQRNIKGPNREGFFDAGTLYKSLFQKIPGADNENMTMANFLKSAGSLTDEQHSSMKLALERIMAMQAQSAVQGADMRGIEVPALLDLYTRIAGARLGQLAGSVLPGGRSQGLVEESAGSKYAQMITQEVPFLQANQAFQDVLLNPEELMAALRTPRSAEEKEAIMRRMLNFIKKSASETGKAVLGAPGLRAVTRGPSAVIEEVTSTDAEAVDRRPPPRQLTPQEEFELRKQKGLKGRNLGKPPRERKPDATQDLLNRAQEILRNRDASVQKPPAVNPTTQAAPPAAPSSTTAAGANPQQRATYAALFPNDPISGMLRQQPRIFSRGGIASLME